MPGTRSWLRPTGLVTGPEARRLVVEGHARPLLGGPQAFTLVERIVWDGGIRPPVRSTLPVVAVDPVELRPFTAAPAAPFDRPRLMGILNVTPDSFSDGGAHADSAAAIAHGLRLVAEGADMIDVGGESTRPGATPVPAEEELRRVVPVVEGLAREGVMVSIDTRKAVVMEAALAAGARLVNDVSGLAFDPAAPAVAARAAARGAWIVLMHMRGTPATMNEAPAYRACALEVADELAARLATALAAGIPRQQVILDPGFCFAKHEPHNVELLRDLALLHRLGCPLLVGLSRKGWASWLESVQPPAARLPGSLVAAHWALERGVRLLRVHEVAATRQAVDAWVTLAGRA